MSICLYAVCMYFKFSLTAKQILFFLTVKLYVSPWEIYHYFGREYIYFSKRICNSKKYLPPPPYIALKKGKLYKGPGLVLGYINKKQSFKIKFYFRFYASKIKLNFICQLKHLNYSNYSTKVWNYHINRNLHR